MPKLSTPLNDTKIKALRPKAKRYLIADGGGLVLEVMTSEKKIWRYRYSLNAKQQPLLPLATTLPSVCRMLARLHADTPRS
jgi:hypothetical protein